MPLNEAGSHANRSLAESVHGRRGRRVALSLPPHRTRSRYNSPFGPGSPVHGDRPISKMTASETNADGEKPKMLLEQWTEPALAPPRPSFVEAGIERHGVLQNMSALGALPTAKVIKAAATAGDTGVRGAAGKKSTPSASTPGESNPNANVTPEPTAPPSRPASSHDIAEEAPATASMPVDATEPIVAPRSLSTTMSVPTPPPAPAPLSIITTPTFLAAQVPQALPQTPQQMSPRRYVPPTTAMQQKMGQSVFALSRPAQPVAYPVALPVTPVMHQMPRFQQSIGDMISPEFTDKIVEAAVNQAIDQEKWPTAYALRTLYDDQRKNPRMVQLINRVFTSRADADEIDQFKRVMKHKKQEGRKDGLAEYYFFGDGSDPAPKTHCSSNNAQASTYSTPSARSGSVARTMSDAQARRSSFALSSVSASPHKEHEQHISKKHKGNQFPSANIELLGSASASAEDVIKDNTPRKYSHGHQNGMSNSGGRRRSMSSLSSLSSLDEKVLHGDDYTNLDDSSDIPRDSPNDAAGLDDIVAAPTQAHHRPTPYANAQNSASAETHARSEARNQPTPITGPTTKGPKTYTFSTVTTSSPSLSSSINNHANAANSGQRSDSSTNNSMAPAALLSSATLLSPSYQIPPSTILKSKKDLNKALARTSLDENDSTAGRMKRDARKATEKNTPTAESFERSVGSHQISLSLLPEFESGSDGGDSVVPKQRSTKLRLLNNTKKTKTTRQTPVNYDSDTLSSPTALSFAPDIAPGSASASRAGTPNALNRPTRKGKTGTGLRIKTS